MSLEVLGTLIIGSKLSERSGLIDLELPRTSVYMSLTESPTVVNKHI